MSAAEHFEQWWAVKGWMFPVQLRSVVKVAFLDAFYRAEKEAKSDKPEALITEAPIVEKVS